MTEHDAEAAPAGDPSATAPEIKVSCLHRGNTFFGTYAVHARDGLGRMVVVRYNGGLTSAEAEDFPAEEVAEELLRQLVVREFALRDQALGG